MSAAAAACGRGVHFRAIDRAVPLGHCIGDTAYRFVRRHIEGTAKQQ